MSATTLMATLVLAKLSQKELKLLLKKLKITIQKTGHEMKTKQEIAAYIRNIENDFKHILTGSLATIEINSPRALEQINTEARLRTLHWVLGTEYESKLREVNT